VKGKLKLKGKQKEILMVIKTETEKGILKQKETKKEKQKEILKQKVKLKEKRKEILKQKETKKEKQKETQILRGKLKLMVIWRAIKIQLPLHTPQT
jgi:predicted P-loop ATPase/GTPase